METIELSGYTLEEKVAIANRWIIPKLLKKHGLERKDIALSVAVIKRIVADYARGPGVRGMEQTLAKLCRRAALKKVTAREKKKFAPTPDELEEFLGGPKFQTEKALKNLKPGVVTGLAWTANGGEILFIETIPLEGKGGFKLTGQLGDVMNESANIAHSYVKKILQQRIVATKKKKQKTKKKEPDDFLSNHEVHLHLPAGATPKDGPSAGVTMALALYGLAVNRRINPSLAMTGELGLTGRVLPVGGIKEKVLAAKRAGIKDVILPKDNEKDLKEVPDRHRKGLKFHPVDHFDQILNIAFK